MTPRTTLDRIVAVAFALSAVAVAAVVVTVAVRREFFPPGQDPSARINEPIPVDNWEELVASGHGVGPRDAAATIVVFEDFECPACRQLVLGPLRDIRNRYGDEVRVIYRHWPLPYHRFAYPAARAAECAAAQGRFEAYHDLLFEKQDSLGLKTFTEFAVESGVPDIPTFDECNSATDPVSAITTDIAAVRGLEATGTPTVLINGLRLPSFRLLEPLVEAAVSGELKGAASGAQTMAPTLIPWDSVPELRLVPELRIGGASAGLTRMGRVAVAGDGSMAVQPETASIVVFNAQGARIGSVGRGGGGVVEIGNVTRFGWKGDTLWVYDLTQDRLLYSTFPGGLIVRTAPFARDADPEPSRAELLPAAFSSLLPLALYADGSIYARSIVGGELPERPVSPTVQRYVRINPAGQVSQIVAEVPGVPYVRMSTTTGYWIARTPFHRGALHDVSPYGHYVATVTTHIEGHHGGRFEVVVQGALGDTVYAGAYPFDGVPIPSALADSVVEDRVAGMSGAQARLFREAAPIPPVYPPVSSIVVGGDGTVWVGLRAADNERKHLVLDPRGTPLGVANLPESTGVVAADGLNVWVVERDASGVEGVVRYRARIE